MRILELKQRFNGLNIHNISVDSIKETKEQYLDKQKEQLKKGLKKSGEKIGRYRNPVYAQKKFNQNPLAGLGNVDLKLTGDLYSATFLDVRDTELVIDSSDEKTQGLIDKYGDPFGLSEESRKAYLNEDLQPVFMANVKNKLKK